MARRLFCAALLVAAASGMMMDVLSPHLLPGPGCPHGCRPWASANATIDSWWANGRPSPGAGSQCAQLANAPGLSRPSPVLDPHGVGGVGAWCLCAGDGWDYCVSPEGIPEQINVQVAGPHTYVVAFVTFEASAPGGPPQLETGSSAAGLAPYNGTAVTHEYRSPSGERVYYMHFVVMAGLPPRTRHFYRVKSGGKAAGWSEVHSFRSGYSSEDGGETRVAIFGDMGVYAWNNMGNLLNDSQAGLIDLVVHMGDHCYNIGGSDDRRGDGYMQAYEQVLEGLPWLPVVGNHEFYDGDKLARYLNQTEGTVVAGPSVEHPLLRGSRSTADSSVGALLSRGNHHGAGMLGATPSGTSRWYSVDFGLIHFVALDLNMYNGVDSCGEPCRQSQLAWLERDLAAANANRQRVPWIVAMSHFPLYCSNCPAPGSEPGAWWNAEQCEFEGHDQNCTAPANGPAVGGAGNADMVPDFEPLFMKYGVDVYSSGHIHDYEFIYPVYNNKPVAKNFTNPRAPVHLVTGNGGPPSPSRFSAIKPWSHTHSTAYSYTRLTAANASHMLWTQVANQGGSVLYELWVTQDQHGAFPIPADD